MFGKNQTLIKCIENKIYIFLNSSDMSSSLGAKIKMAAIFFILGATDLSFCMQPSILYMFGGV